MKTLTFRFCIFKICFKVLKNCYHTVAISLMFWKWNFIKNSIIFFKIREVNDIIYHLLLFFINYSNIFTNSGYPSFSKSSFLINLIDALLIQYLSPPDSVGPSGKTCPKCAFPTLLLTSILST